MTILSGQEDKGEGERAIAHPFPFTFYQEVLAPLYGI